ncbi:unnamed protein product [Caenorhabditis brenneri]
MPASSAKKSSKKLKKVKKPKRSIEQPVHLDGTKRIRTMAPILRSQKGKTTSTTTTTSSPLGNSNHQPRRQDNKPRNFNGKPQGPQQNSRGDPVSKKEFIAEGRPYGKNNGHQGTIPIPSGSQPKLKPMVTQPPIRTAEEQENQNNLIKEALQKGTSQVTLTLRRKNLWVLAVSLIIGSQGSFDEQRIGNEQHQYDPRTTMPTPIPIHESTTSTLSPITTTMTPTDNLQLYGTIGATIGIIGFLVVGNVAMCYCGGFKWIGNWFRRNFGKDQTDDFPSPLPIAAPPTPPPQSSFWDWFCFWKKREPTPDEYVHPDKIPYTKNRSRRIIPSANRGPGEIQRLVNNEPNRSPDVSEHGKAALKKTGKDAMNKKQPEPAPKNNEEQKHEDAVAAKDNDDSFKRSIADEEKSFEIQLPVYDEPVGSSTDSGFEKMLEELSGAGKSNMNEEQPAKPNREAEKAEEDAAVREFEDSLKRTVEDEGKAKENQKRLEELEEDIRNRKKELKKKEEEEKRRRDTSNDAGDFAEADEIDRKFREDMDRQNREFQEKMEQLREQRREKQRIADEEFQELRREMQLRLAAFLECLQLKRRFIEKKEEWEDFLKKLRELLVKIINSYYELQKEVKNFDSTDEFSQDCLYNEGKMFAKKVANAQHMFSNAFNNLKALSENYDDRIFIKMIMKSISKQAHLCNDVGEELVEVLMQKSKDIRKLDDLVSRIDSQGIPTTGRLTKESVHAREEDYANIEDVSLPEWFRYFM